MPRDPLQLAGSLLADKYEVQAAVGEGGFATVYRAEHKIWKKPVAIKFFTELSRLPEAKRGELADAFIQEGSLLTELSTQTAAIVQARDVGFYTGAAGQWIPYLVMEWLDGQPLDDLIYEAQDAGRGQFAIEQVLSLLGPIAEALSHAHLRGVVHRDVKPANIFVLGDPADEAPTVKLLDFGVAKVMTDTDIRRALTQTGQSVSSFTPHYGAPEQFTRRLGATGPWTDVFALALVITEMLSGQVGLAGQDIAQLGFSSADPEFRPTPRNLGAKVNDQVESVMRRALAVSPEERFPDAGAFWKAFVAAAQSGPPAHLTPAVLPRDLPEFTSRTAATAPTTMDTGDMPSPPALDRTPSAVERKATTATDAAGSSAHLGWVAVALATLALGVAGLTRFLATDDREDSPVGDASDSQPAQAPEPAPCPGGMTEIAAGQFFMGSDDRNARDNEHPAHNVTLDRYCIDTTEVTMAAYNACSNEGKCRRAGQEVDWPGITEEDRTLYSTQCNANLSGRADHPVNCVSWQMANEYCSSVDKRLPSEAEWEYAARGPDGRVYPWGDEDPTAEHLNACGSECEAWGRKTGAKLKKLYDSDDGFVGTAPVGQFKKGSSRFGPHDIVGNVWEWVSDWDGEYGSAPQNNPQGPETGERKIIRGGAFNGGYASWLRPSFRYAQDPEALSHGIGFRCAKSLF